MHVSITYFGVVTGSGAAQTKAQKPASANNEVYMLDLRREIKAGRDEYRIALQKTNSKIET